MATIINNPPTEGGGGSGMGFFLGIVLLIAVLIILFIYGIPFARNAFQGLSAPSIQIPEQIDVNVNGPK